MKTLKTKVELLAPAGSFPSLIAAVKAGADAVYFGLDEGLNMRANAKNFSIANLKKIKEICTKTIRGKKVRRYLTLNTLVYDSEISKIEKIIKEAKKYIDAIICWDLSVIELCRKYRIPFHISTQASVANKKSALFYKKLGAERIVLARELNLNQIREISQVIDTEVFCHGAMCVSISGRCFTSQFLFEKSANRGECLQPCRRAYVIKDEEGNELKLENNTVMSAKDLCTLEIIEDIKKAGVKAIKIEGRNREPEYVDAVVRVYRKALDKKLGPSELRKLLEELQKVYNKGFSRGFYLKTPEKEGFSREEHSSSREKKEYIGEVFHYFSKAGVAAIRISSGKIRKGDEIYAIGNKTGVIRKRIDRIEINGKEKEEAFKGQEIGIKLSGVREKDKIYKIIQKK